MERVARLGLAVGGIGPTPRSWVRRSCVAARGARITRLGGADCRPLRPMPRAIEDNEQHLRSSTVANWSQRSRTTRCDDALERAP